MTYSSALILKRLNGPAFSAVILTGALFFSFLIPASSAEPLRIQSNNLGKARLSPLPVAAKSKPVQVAKVQAVQDDVLEESRKYLLTFQNSNTSPAVYRGSSQPSSQGFQMLSTEVPDDSVTPTLTSSPPPSTLYNSAAVMSDPAKPQINPAILIIPVMVHGSREKAFADVPVVLSNAISARLNRSDSAQTRMKVLNPVYAYDEIRMRGLDGLYNKISRDFLEAGQPNEEDVQYLSDKMAEKTRPIRWIAFVQAELDMNRASTTHWIKRPLGYLYDHTQTDPTYFLSSKVTVYEVKSGMPMIWDHHAETTIKKASFGNFTRSVFDDDDSAMKFKNSANMMAMRLVTGLPQAMFTSVVNTNARVTPVQADSMSSPAVMTPADVDALNRISE